MSTVSIAVSAKDQEAIYEKALSTGESIGGFMCAVDVSTALQGVGPFKNLEITRLPGTLLKEVRAIRDAQEGSAMI